MLLDERNAEGLVDVEGVECGCGAVGSLRREVEGLDCFDAWTVCDSEGKGTTIGERAEGWVAEERDGALVSVQNGGLLGRPPVDEVVPIVSRQASRLDEVLDQAPLGAAAFAGVFGLDRDGKAKFVLPGGFGADDKQANIVGGYLEYLDDPGLAICICCNLQRLSE